jgi:uncharacterized protein YbaR (Trm112 family)
MSLTFPLVILCTPDQRNRTCPLCKGDLHVMQAERRDAIARGEKDPLAFGPDVKMLEAPAVSPSAASGKQATEVHGQRQSVERVPHVRPWPP